MREDNTPDIHDEMIDLGAASEVTQGAPLIAAFEVLLGKDHRQGN